MITTPGTKVAWSTLAEWIAAAHQLAMRRSSKKRYEDIDAHWFALPDGYIETAPLQTLAEFINLLQSPCNIAWGKPNRGARRGTKWERLNVAARNAQWRLIRDDDLAGVIGHNSSNRPITN